MDISKFETDGPEKGGNEYPGKVKGQKPRWGDRPRKGLIEQHQLGKAFGPQRVHKQRKKE